MPRNGSGTYAPPAGQPVVSGTTISSTVFNALVADVGTEITRSVSTDGQTPMAANLPMGGNKITNLAAGTNPSDALRLDQLTNSTIFVKTADLAASSGSSLAGFTQSGAGAVARTVQSKLRDTVSVLDFGADPTFTSDSTAAFQAAIVFGDWNGSTILIPNGTYRIDGTIFIGANGANSYHSVHLVGESTQGSVLMRKTGTGTGPVITMNGFHNILEKFTIIGDTSGGTYPASQGIYIRGNPQAGTNGLGTKYCVLRNLTIQRVGVAIQLGNYDVDGIDPDIETNHFEAVSIVECAAGIFVNGQNILHNPFYNFHVVNCRDYLAKVTRGSDLWFERSYFGGMYDYLTSNYNVPATSKVIANAGTIGFIGCRNEEWATAAGNTTQRYFLNVNSSASSVVYLAGNVFTTRDNATTEPCCSFNGSGVAGSISTKVTLVDNDFGGYVNINTIDVFSLGNTYRGTGAGVTNGRVLSANQTTQAFRDVFLDSNQTMELPGAKFKRNSSVPVIIERAAVATGSEFLGHQYYDEPGLLWNRVGVGIRNGTGGSESSVMIFGNRMAGSFIACGLAYGTAAPGAGTWARGDIVENSSPAVGSPKSWKCTVAGSPGTWVSTGNL